MKLFLSTLFIFLFFVGLTAQTIIQIPPGIQDLLCINFHNQYGVSGGYHINFNDTTLPPPPPTEGKIIHTSNGFNWELSSIPANITSIGNIQLTDDQLGYASGSRHDTSVFLKTTDGGASWNNYGDLNYFKSITSQCFIDNYVGFLAVDNKGYAEILKTTKGGASWVIVLSLHDSSKINKIVFGNSSIGFALGTIRDTCILLKTTDGGISWFRNITSATQKIQDITFSDSLTYYFVSQDTFSRAYKTTDAGTTWIRMILNESSFLFRKIDFLPGGNIGFIFWDNLIVGYYKTTDNGNSWTDPYGFDIDYSILATCMAPGNKYYLTIAGIFGGAILLVDGNTPVELGSFESKLFLNSVLLKWTTATEKNNKGFIVQRKFNKGNWQELGFITGNGTSTDIHSYNFSDKLSESGNYLYRLKQIDFDGRVEYSKEVEVSFNSPEKYSLEQNYPNPFNPSTTISYSISLSSKVKIIVYNTLGQSIKVLENGFKNAGNYSANFNAADLPSGIYFYRFEAGKFSQVKKMILIK
jgi:photosystem II stability/assembly factor-like uncharacterized protein